MGIGISEPKNYQNKYVCQPRMEAFCLHFQPFNGIGKEVGFLVINRWLFAKGWVIKRMENTGQIWRRHLTDAEMSNDCH